MEIPTTLLDKLYTLFASSQVTQGIITIVMLVGTFVLLFDNRTVPDIIWTFDGIVIGFFFGGKIGAAQQKAKNERGMA